jgi:nicotinamidase/pyrazinamidase
MKLGIIYVDLQADFCEPSGSLFVFGSNTLAADIEAMEAAIGHENYASIFTLDSHPADHVSFVTNNPGTNLYDEITLPDGVKQVMWPVHCVDGTPGHAIAPPLERFVEAAHKRAGGFFEVKKGTIAAVDSYSGFGSADGVSEITPLLAYLLSKGITHLLILGVAFDYCVAATAKDALKHGFKTCVVRQATRFVAAESTMKEEKLMKEAGVVIADTLDQMKAFLGEL